MKFIHSLSCVVLVSCLSVNARVAEANVPNPTSSDQTEPMLMANFFERLQDAVQTIEQVDDAIDLLDQVLQQDDTSSPESQESRNQIEQRTINQTPTEVDENLYQRLARRNNEDYEAWYDRIQPMINVMPGTDYRAWKATLPSEDREAFDAIVRQRNYEAAETMNQAIPAMLDSFMNDDTRRRNEYCAGRGRGVYVPGYGYCN